MKVRLLFSRPQEHPLEFLSGKLLILGLDLFAFLDPIDQFLFFAHSGLRDGTLSGVDERTKAPTWKPEENLLLLRFVVLGPEVEAQDEHGRTHKDLFADLAH